MIENIVLAFQGVWSHKMRSALTMLGIIIGIASIISIVSTIKGTNEQIKQNLIGAGNNAVKVQLYQGDSTMDFSWTQVPDGVPVFTEEERKALSELDNVEAVSFYNSRSYSENVFYKNNSFSGAIYGIDDQYFDVYGYYVQWGRNFRPEDRDTHRKVCILDSNAVKGLFTEGINPVGQVLEIASEPFTIVGIVAQSSGFEPVINSLSDYWTYNVNNNGQVFIPDAMWGALYKFDEPQSCSIRAANTDAMTNVGNGAAKILNATLNVKEGSDLSYKSENLLEQAKQLQDLSAATNQQLIWIAGISLLVGGIGVMNIMLVSVTERTREIGLKKAIGARKSRILGQFLTEAAVLTSLGGLLGVGAGVVLAYAISKLTATPTAIDALASLIAVAFSMVIGLVFGFFPAVKAANLNPIDALRRD